MLNVPTLTYKKLMEVFGNQQPVLEATEQHAGAEEGCRRAGGQGREAATCLRLFTATRPAVPASGSAAIKLFCTFSRHLDA